LYCPVTWFSLVTSTIFITLILQIFSWFSLLFLGVIAMLWWQNRGYQVVGATGESLVSALRASMNRLNLEYQEELTRVRLPSVGAELVTTGQPGFGIAYLRMQPREHRDILNGIAAEMNRYYRDVRSETNKTAYLLYIAVGFLLIVVLTHLRIESIW
jgi:hypothetical protein